MSKALLVPIKIAAIVQPEDKAVIGPEMDFDALPYFDNDLGIDINADSPYLAESIVPQPFSDANYILRKGVHLNWDFPKFLKSTKYGSSDATRFPPVPTRWLVSRYSNKTTPDKQWIVESDAVLENLQGMIVADMAQTTIVAEEGKRPYSYVGRVSTLEEWKARGGRPNKNFTTWKATHQQEPLTAMGWGSPAFDVFYPNCQGVFGFHDPEITEETAGVKYKIVGWHDDASDDYWNFYLSQRLPELEEIVRHLNELGQLSAEDKKQHATETISKMLENELGIKLSNNDFVVIIDNDIKLDLPSDGMLCYGEISWTSPSESATVAEPIFAIGNTPIEALSAMIVGEKFPELNGLNREKKEDTFEAILMGDRLKSLKADIGPKFREFRHANEFLGTKGGQHWVIQTIDDNPDKELHGDPLVSNEREELPENVIPLLENLNTAQRQYDKALFELESLKTELYADWYRYMHCAYPPPGETEEYIEQAEIRAVIEAGSLARCKAASEALGKQLTYDMADMSGDQFGLAGNVRKAWMALQEGLVEATRIRMEKIAQKGLQQLAKSLSKNIPDQSIVDHIVKTGQVEIAQRLREMPEEVFRELAHKGVQPETSDSLKQLYKNSFDGLKSTIPIEALPTEEQIQKTLPFIARFHWEVQNTPAARFWEPTSPVVVMATPKASTETPPMTAAISTCQLFEGSVNFDPSEFNINGLPDGFSDSTFEVEAPFFKAEWEAEVFPLSSIHSNIAVSGKYDPDFILNNYFLGENQPDVNSRTDLNSPSAVEKTASVYTGSSFVNDKVSQRYWDLLDEFEKLNNADETQGFIASTEIDRAKEFLANHDLKAVTLNGFNAALLQMHQSIQLHPKDPLGFEDFQAFADEVAGVLTEGKGWSPDPHSVFMPIRTGALRVLALRMVDVFGRFTNFEPSRVHTPFSMRVDGNEAWAMLQPRLSQAARVQFRFLQSEGTQMQDAHSHRASTPVAGWIIPNLLDGSFLFYQEDGKGVGQIDQNGQWKDFLGAEPSDTLIKVKNWLLQASMEEGTFLQTFMERLEEAMDNIHPNDREDQSAFSVLMGRPMAIVRAGVKMELKGLPATNINWSEFKKDMDRPSRETDDFEWVKFPLRLGEYRQRNDGLVGYWQVSGAGELSPAFKLNDSINAIINDLPDESNLQGFLKTKNEEWQRINGKTLFQYLAEEKKGDNEVKKQDLIQQYVDGGSKIWQMLVEAGWITETKQHPELQHYAQMEHAIAVADEMQQFICLLDPFGSIHLSTAIQPVKDIQLPDHFVKGPLQKIEVSFHTAPVLGPEAAIELSLAKEEQYAWQWREKNTWGDGNSTNETIIEEKDLKPFRTIANFPHRNVLREGKLILKHKEEETTP